MSSPLVSIVIPIYNIAPYLERCLKSVFAQTYKNLEIIAVDDGSTDDCSKILKQYLKKNPHLKVIRQENSGLSAARNTGLKNAKGEYIAFIDGDDCILPDYIKVLLTTLIENNADISVCGYISVKRSIKTAYSPDAKVLTGHDATVRLLVGQENLDIVTWNKLYKRELFLKNKITYPVGEPHEDNLTTYKLYASTSKVALVSKPLYLYYERPGSIMKQSKMQNRLKYRERAAREALAYFAKDSDLKSAAEVSLLLAYFAYLDASIKGEIPKSYTQKAISRITTHSTSYKTNPYLTKKLRLYLWMITHFNAKPYKLFRKTYKGRGVKTA